MLYRYFSCGIIDGGAILWFHHYGFARWGRLQAHLAFLKIYFRSIVGFTGGKAEHCSQDSNLEVLIVYDKRMFLVLFYLKMCLTVKVYFSYILIERWLLIFKSRFIKNCHIRTVRQTHRSTLSFTGADNSPLVKHRLTFHIVIDSGCH